MKNLMITLVITIFATGTVSAQQLFTDVFEGSKTIVLDGIFKDLNLKKGVAKMTVPVNLPKEAKGFYYRITVLPKNRKIQEASFNLLENIQGLSNNASGEEVVHHIKTYPSSLETNVYLVQGQENADGLKRFGYFEYRNKFVNKRSFCGYIENNKMDNFYIGVENKYELKGVKVILELVAVN